MTITTLKDYTKLTVEVKVVGVEHPTEIGEGRKKQDIFVADKTYQSRMTIWEDNIGKVEKGKSYRFCGILVREFRGEKYITTAIN